MIANEHFNLLYLQMKEEVGTIGSSTSNPLRAAEQSYLIVSNYCDQVKAPKTFNSPESEVVFFKKIRPGFEAELLYFGELYYILSTLPRRRKDRIRHFAKQYAPIRLFYRRYQLLYEYWSLGRSDCDSQLFTRDKVDAPLLIMSPLPLGDSHCTPAGKVFARFRAYSELHGFLDKEISRLENRTAKESQVLKWTATKAALVELAYALKATGAINNGNASIRDIATHLERVFAQDLSQFYRTFQEIRIRKNSRTTFLDRMKEKLERWMDNTDLNSRGED
ncbi:RteC protein [Algoriphagus locisalis]|uniref:RteC protein n=1 Tax=Algoriphagus locisalis TaxID=305507 RepID=A0A1I7E5D8_9BACT|nr:RteC domain-containing protein [Algoriphagus locisalis]SFU19148.1 RteC protein [Algoriphagus locisalis]